MGIACVVPSETLFQQPLGGIRTVYEQTSNRTAVAIVLADLKTHGAPQHRLRQV